VVGLGFSELRGVSGSVGGRQLLGRLDQGTHLARLLASEPVGQERREWRLAERGDLACLLIAAFVAELARQSVAFGNELVRIGRVQPLERVVSSLLVSSRTCHPPSTYTVKLR
jgi:hypothetical protein